MGKFNLVIFGFETPIAKKTRQTNQKTRRNHSVVHSTDQVLIPPTMVELLNITDSVTPLNVSFLLACFNASRFDPQDLPGSLGYSGQDQRLTLVAPVDGNFEYYMLSLIHI